MTSEGKNTSGSNNKWTGNNNNNNNKRKTSKRTRIYEALLVEVKGPTDTLADHQVMIDYVDSPVTV